MTIERRLSFISFCCLALAGIALSACGNDFPDCDDDNECADYNGDSSSEGYNRGLTICVDGQCRECRANTDCDQAQGEECRNNSCERIPGWCNNTGMCPNGQICVNNACTAGCDDTHGCTGGMVCRDHTCQPECNLDSDCPSGQVCQNHQCVENPAVCGDRQFEVVYFDFDESIIRTDQEPRLESNAECLNAFPSDDIRIEGHCDERGTDAYNLALGERRARASKRYLENLGIGTDRMDIISYGESRPTCRESNESCWRQNRRTEFVWR